MIKKKKKPNSLSILPLSISSGLASPRHLQPQAPVRNLASAAGLVQPLGRRAVAFVLRNSTHSGSAEDDQRFGKTRSVGHFTKLYDISHLRESPPANSQPLPHSQNTGVLRPGARAATFWWKIFSPAAGCRNSLPKSRHIRRTSHQAAHRFSPSPRSTTPSSARPSLKRPVHVLA